MPWGSQLSPIDEFRLRMLQSQTSLASLVSVWPYFEPVLRSYAGQTPTPLTVRMLGDHLSEAFRAPAATLTGRGQGTLSQGGTAWELLVTWYLNLVFFGSPIIASRRHKEWIPEVISETITVRIGNDRTNTESDVIVFGVPPMTVTGPIRLSDLDAAVRSNKKAHVLAVVQCKTNWNDNAQIPMLWDLIYKSAAVQNQHRIPGLTVGINGNNPYDFADFKYAFVTVPTTERGSYGQNATAVIRVRNLSGGNYWGKASSVGATGFSEFPIGQFGYAYSASGGFDAFYARQLATYPDLVERFLRLDFWP